MSALLRFRRDQKGVAAIEFALIAPLVTLLLIGSGTFFAAFRADARSKTATYTISDMVARQSSVDDTFLANVKDMFGQLAPKSPTAPGVRITSAVKVGLAYVIEWSYATTPYSKMTTLSALTARLPDSATGQSLLIVETSVPYQPVFRSSGATLTTFENLTTQRPRYVARVTKN